MPRFAVAFIAGFFSLQLSAQCSPQKIVRIVTEDRSPNIPAGSFAGRPKTLYRLGTKYARLEEEADSTNGIQALIVMSEPDLWIVNLANHTGKHVIDRGPTFDIHTPVLQKDAWPAALPPEFLKLELGCEQAFFDGFHSPITKLKTPDGDLAKQAVGIGGWMLVLVRQGVSNPPGTLFLLHDDKIALALKYTSYQVLAEPDMKLFEKPKGIEIEEPGPP